MRRLGFALALLGPLGLACEDTPPPASGNLGRPTGMAYIQRSATLAQVFIADPAAGGIRVLQLSTDQEAIARFIPAPQLFFPLAIPVPAFPTALETAADQNHIFALSEISREVHVLDTRAVSYDARASEVDTFVPRGKFSLREQVDDAFVPSDLLVLPARDDLEQLIVAGDQDDRGLLLHLAIDLRATPPAIRSRDTIEVPLGARGLAYRGVFPSGFWVASATTSEVTFFSVAGSAPAAAQVIDVGGPTREVVDLGAGGALALRLDRSAAVWIQTSTLGVWSRGTQPLSSPYTRLDSEESPAEVADRAGRLDLRSPGPWIGASTRLKTLRLGAAGDMIRSTDRDARGEAQVTMITHGDGVVTVLVGSPPRVASEGETAVSQVGRTREDDTVLAQCPLGNPLTCTDRSSATLMCGDLIESQIATSVQWDAEYRGALAQARGGRLLLTGTSSTGGLRARLLPSDATGLLERQIRAGDEALLQLELPQSCGATETVELSVTATVLGATRGSVDLVFSPETFADVEFCENEDALGLDRYEIYPTEDEFVLRRENQSGQIVSVAARIPASSRQSVQIEREGLRLTLTSSSSFGCTLEVSAAQASCFSAAECPGGSTCIRTDSDVSVGCPGRCAQLCAAGDARCLTGPLERRCSGARLRLTAPPLGLVDLLATGEGGTLFLPAAPGDMLFAPVHKAFLVSFPGGGGLSEIIVGAGVIGLRSLR